MKDIKQVVFNLLEEQERHALDEPTLNKYGEWEVCIIDTTTEEINGIGKHIGHENLNKIIDEYYK